MPLIVQALRSLWKRPFALTATALSLAVGVGLNGGVLAALWGAFGGALPYSDYHELVTVVAAPTAKARRVFLSEAEATQLRSFHDLFEAVTTIERWPASRRAWMDVEHAGRASRVSGALVLPNAFEVLGVNVSGRTFSAADAAGSARVAIVTERFAARHFGEGSAIGLTIRLNGDLFTIVGQLPANFVAPTVILPPPNEDSHAIDVWIPQDPKQVAGGDGGSLQYSVIARVSRVNLAALSGEVSRRLKATLPRAPADGYAVVSLRSSMLGTTSTNVAVIAVLGLLLFGVALFNVTIVSLLRVDELESETAIRAALGASGWRLWLSPAVEAGILICVGAASGALTSGLVASIIVAGVPGATWIADKSWVAWVSGAVAAGVSTLAALFTVGWLIRGQARRVSGALTTIWHSSRLSRRPSHLQLFLTAAQHGLAIVLAAPAVALWFAFAQVDASNAHLDRPDVIVAQAWLLDRGPDALPDVVRAKESLRARIAALGGVAEVGLASDPPLVGSQSPMLFVRAPSGNTKRSSAFGDAVDASYLSLAGLSIVRGRSFEAAASPAGRLQALVSEAFARGHFGGSDPVGQFIDYRGKREVIGVVRDEVGRDSALRAAVYVPLHDVPYLKLTALIKVSDAAAAPDVVTALRTLDGSQPLDSVQLMSTLTDLAFADQWIFTRVAGVFAAGALVLALLGIILMTQYWALLARTEVATRSALGGLPRRIATAFTVRQLRLSALAAAVGAPLGLLALHGVSTAVLPLAIPSAAALVAAVLSVVGGSSIVTFTVFLRAASQQHAGLGAGRHECATVAHGRRS